LLPLFFCFFYCCYEQGNSSKLVAIAHFVFLMLEANKATITSLLSLSSFFIGVANVLLSPPSFFFSFFIILFLLIWPFVCEE
jgi:hypothetical protein